MNLYFLLHVATLSSICIVLESKPSFLRNHNEKDVKTGERYNHLFSLRTRRRRQSSSSSANSAARPNYAIPQSIPYASLSLGVVPPRLQNRLASGTSTSESSNSAASASASSSSRSPQSDTGSAYGGRSPYMGAVPQYGSQGGVYSNPYAGYQPSVPQYSQHSPGPVPVGRSIYPYRTPTEARYGGISNTGGGGYRGGGGGGGGRTYPPSTGIQTPQYGSSYQMTGRYSTGINPYAAAGAYGGYGQRYQPVNQYAYPTPRGGGGYYYGNRFMSYPLGTSIGSVYRDPSVRPLGHENRGSYGSSFYSGGAGRYVSGTSGGSGTYGSTAPNPYSSTYGSDGSPYGGGGTPYRGGGSYSSGTGYGRDYGGNAGSYGGAGATGSNPYTGGGSAPSNPYLGGGSSASNPYPGTGSAASNPYHGGSSSASNPYPGDGSAISNPYPGTGSAASNPYLGGGSSASNPYAGGGSSASNPYPGAGSAASNPYPGSQDSSQSGTYSQYGDSSSFGSNYGNADGDSSNSDDNTFVPYGGGGGDDGGDSGGQGSYPDQFARGNMRFNENQYAQTSGSRYGSSNSYAGTQDQGGNQGKEDANAEKQSQTRYGYGSQYLPGGSDTSADQRSGSRVSQGSSRAGAGQTFGGYQGSRPDPSSQDYQTGQYYSTQDNGSQNNYGQVPLGSNPFSQSSSSTGETSSNAGDSYQSSQDAQANDGSDGYYSPNEQQDTSYAVPQSSAAGRESVVAPRTESSSSTENSETGREMIPRGSDFQYSQNGPILVSRHQENDPTESEREVTSEIENAVGGAVPTTTPPSMEKCRRRTDGLPDLYIAHRDMKSSMFLEIKSISGLKCAKEEGCLSPSAYLDQPITPRKLLRFATITHNNGTADFVPPEPSSEWVFHTCHDHYHSMKQFAHYNLINQKGEILEEGHKASFCLEDSKCINPCTKKYSCKRHEQSISPGCQDTYLASRDCQWIDVTDVPNGKYVLQVTVNPILDGGNRAVAELSYANNVVECDVSITATLAKAHRCWLA